MTYIVLFAFNFFSVMVKVIQQIQVVNFEYLKIIPASYAMSMCLVINIGLIAPLGQDLPQLLGAGLVAGTGAWMGSWLGMRIKEKRQ